MFLLIGLASASTIWTVSDYRDTAWQDGAQPGDVIEFSWSSGYDVDWIGTGLLVETNGLTFRGATPETEIPPLWFDGVTGTVGPGRMTDSALSFGITSTPHYVALRADDASVTIDSVAFDGVAARGAAPANPTHPVWLIDSHATFVNTTFSDCGSDDPDYPYIVASENTTGNVALTFDGVTFNGSGSVGGVAVQATAGSADIDVKASTFYDLYAANGAAIHVDSGDATLDVEGSDFSYNRATSAGGAIYAQNGLEVTLSDVGCEAGWAYTGACFYQFGGTLNATGLDVREGSSTGGGSAIASLGAATTVSDSSFCRGNAGVESDVYAVEGSLDVVNSVFMGSTSPAALSAKSGAEVRIENVTFAGNAYAAIYGNGLDDFRMINTVLQGGQTGLSLENSSYEGLDYNLWFDNDTDSSGISAGPHAVFEEPLYEDFDPTWCDTRPVPADFSPVIDAGSPELEDPWGGRSDIGMYGGPGAEDIGGREPPRTESDTGSDSGSDSGIEPADTGTPGTPAVPGSVWVSGGCHAPLGAGLVVVGLLGLRRRYS